MKYKVSYTTKERKKVGKATYMFFNATKNLELVALYRLPCGTGAAAKRYKYEGDFIAPEDADFTMDGVIRCNINRKDNPKFNPKNFEWVGARAFIGVE